MYLLFFSEKEASQLDGASMRYKKMEEKKGPAAKFKAGQVSAALWENEITTRNGHKATILKASIQRRYKDDKDGQWKSSTSFSRNEIPLAIYCLQKAFEKMLEKQIEGADDGVVEEVVM